jgi:NAD(P)-dependent dehydrogenase (short-subunit alcohol dehydrogenase family)
MSSYIIFGANSDIALNLITQLLAVGHKVYAVARNFRDDYPVKDNLICIKSEFSQFIATDKLVADLALNDSNIIGVANFAGSIFLKPAHLTSEDDFNKIVENNFKTAFAVAHACGKTLSNASIVFISSTATMVGLANHELVAGTKAAINGMVISAAASYIHKNLRFNAIAPALVDTKLANSLLANEASRKISESLNPQGKIGSPQDIANLAYFLLSPDNSWITGQIIAVDGGMSSIRPRMKA